MRMHVQEVSETTSSIAEHDLSDLVPSDSPTCLHEQHGDQRRSALSSDNNDSYFVPGSWAPRIEGGISGPPRAIVYAASTVGQSSRSGHTSSQHPVSLLPTVSPPRYQLSLSHPGTPPSRTGTRRVESSPLDGRGSPLLSQTSVPTTLQQQYSRAAYDTTWRDDRTSTAASLRAPIPLSKLAPGSASLPEYETQESELDPVSYEQHARITEGQYRLGVGYDEHASGTTGRKISDQRRLERLIALEREFGRVKAEQRNQSWNESQAPSLHLHGTDFRKGISRASKSFDEKDTLQVEDGDADDISVRMTFKQMRIKEKEERARLNREFGITKDGNLLTQGRKTRLFLRCMQGLLGLIAVICGLGGAFFTEPPDDQKPAPSGAVSTWLLYIVSLGSLVCTIYLFMIQPCVRRSKSRKTQTNNRQLNPATMPNGIILPIFSSSSQAYTPVGAKQGAFGRKRKKKKDYMRQPSQPMMVNLVVDPNMLGGAFVGSKPPSRYVESGRGEDEEDSGVNVLGNSGQLTAIDGEDGQDLEDDHDFHIPDSHSKAEQARKERQNQPLARMLDTMAVIKLQDEWREARRRMRRSACADAAWSIIWWAEAFFAVGFGGSCKPGFAAGWCDTYNMALASAVLLAVAFSTSFTFDMMDLRRSRSTPRLSRTV